MKTTQTQPVKPEAPKSPPFRLLSLAEYRRLGYPDADSYFRLKRAAGSRGWCVETYQATTGERIELDPWDTIENIERLAAGLVGEAARK